MTDPKPKKPTLFSFVRATKTSNPRLKIHCDTGADVVISLMMLYELLPKEIQDHWMKIPKEIEIANTVTSFQTATPKPSQVLMMKDSKPLPPNA